MMNLKPLFVLALGFSVISFTSSYKSIHTLQKKIKERLALQKGDFAVAFKNLQTGETLGINDHDNFHAASTMKTPVMMEVFKQAGQGRFSLTDSIILKNEFKSIVDGSLYSLDPNDDSEFELYKHLGEKRSIHDLVYQMIIVSSNLATNLIMELVGAENIMITLKQMGITDMKVLRGVEDSKAYQKGLNNTTTAFDMRVLLEKIEKGETINRQASEVMIKILLNQQFNEIIPAQLPKDVKVAHKTGWITASHHDAAIIFLPDGRKYVLVLLSKNLKDEKAGIKAMADVSFLVYKHFIKTK